LEEDHLETDVRSVSIDMDAIDFHKLIQGPSVGVVPILMRYHMSFSMALVPQVQLTSSLAHGDAAPIFKKP
jgi:hypothetical protein